MYGLYGNIYHPYTPVMLAYIPAPWILWVIGQGLNFMDFSDPGPEESCLGHVAAQEGNAGQNLQLTPGHAIPRPCEIHGCV